MDLCIFIGANRDFLFLSLSPSPFLSLSLFLFLSAQIDDQNHCTRVDALHGMKIEMGKETEPFDIFHPRVLMALRLNVPENLRHEQLAHYFTSVWILACIEFPIRIVEGLRVRSKKECLETMRGGKYTSFYLLFNRSRSSLEI